MRMPGDPEPSLQLLDLGKWAGALTAIGAAVALVMRYTRVAVRGVVRWACASDLAAQARMLEAIQERLEAIERRSQLTEERTAIALENTAKKLEDVADAVEHMTRLLVQKGLASG